MPTMLQIETITPKIYSIRWHNVMLDRDFAVNVSRQLVIKLEN